MKKTIQIIFLLLCCFQTFAQQDYDYGVIGGFNNRNERIVNNGISVSTGAGGMFIGFFIDMKIYEKLSVQTEIQYLATFVEQNTSNSIVIPIVGKYKLSDQWSIHAGPLLDLILDGTPLKEFGLGIAIGLGYEITENLFATTRYSLGLTNRLDSDFFPNNFSSQLDFFQIGLGYKF